MSRVSLRPPHMSTFRDVTTYRGSSENIGEEKMGGKKKRNKKVDLCIQPQNNLSQLILHLQSNFFSHLFYNTSLEERQHKWFAHNLLCYLYHLLLKKGAARHQRGRLFVFVQAAELYGRALQRGWETASSVREAEHLQYEEASGVQDCRGKAGVCNANGDKDS